MQFDFFGNDVTAINESSPPIINEGNFKLPETKLFEEALHQGDLSTALKILNRLNTASVWKVLLGSGFTVTSQKDRMELMAGVQKDLIDASRLKLTGFELRNKNNTLFVANDNHSDIVGVKEKENGISRNLQPESVSSRHGEPGDRIGANGGGNRESLDAGMGTQGQIADSGGNLSGSFEESAESRERRSSGSSEYDTSNESRDIPDVRASGITADLAAVSEAVESASEVLPTDYEIIDNSGRRLSLGEKFRSNLHSIKIIKSLEAEKRHATPEERDVLAQYVGWGGLKGVFDPNNSQWANQHHELKALLNDEEYAAARRSQLDSHFTPPVIIKAMYNGLDRMGFKDGRILEPSVGVGAFLGLMPKEMRNGSSLHGVELDVLTSKIVAGLYPSAKIAQATGFQDFSIPAGYFDMVIGNPPFGGQAIADKNGSAYSGWSIHNYFFAKSIEMLRPGGIMPMVVSHSFLDKLDPHVRQWISRRAELVSGVRLPNTAFKDNANTEVVTDILVFRRLDNENMLGEAPNPEWLNTSELSLVNQDTGESSLASVNDYFINNPQNVLGTPILANTMYQANTYTVAESGDLEQQLATWVNGLPEGVYQPLVRTVEELERSTIEIPEGVKEGSYFAVDGKVFQRLPDSMGERRSTEWVPPNNKALERMLGMINIRELLRMQIYNERTYLVTDRSDADLERSRSHLNKVYDSFKEKYGYLNDPVNRRIFIDDTESALVQALEFDYEKAIGETKAAEFNIEPRPAKAIKADILSRRVLFPPMEIANVESAKDALLHSLNQYARVNMSFMTEVYAKSEEDIIDELGSLVYVDPVRGLVTSDSYLSGDVKTKLLEATKAAESDSAFKKNVDALNTVIPADKLPSEIFASIGGAWIPTDIYTSFAKEISGGDAAFTHVTAAGQWLMSDQHNADYGKNHTVFGTDKMSSLSILNSLMNSRGLEVKKRVLVDGQERYVTDEESTEAVRQRGDKIRSHWDSWLWSDGDRALRLTEIYNDRFNRTVERAYDGSHLTFPGMSPAITLLGHQKNGVWRGLQDRKMLADQVVGAGKTFELATMAMEMRRLGIAKKPMFAVPNHLTLQWRSDFYRLYPGANILAATPQDFEKENREKLFSKIVTGNWDAVVIGHSSLKRLGIPQEAEIKLYQEQLDEMSSAIHQIKNERGDRNIIRDMEKIAANLEAKLTDLQKKAGKKDQVVNFEDMGIDALFVDEMHEFKNLFFTTQMQRVAGLGNPAGSGKAFDLFIKIRWLQETFGDNAPLITATGTPVSNSLAEMYTMQRYMQYDALKADGLHMFDTWAKQYGDVQTVYEVAPSGTGYRLSQRFAKFKNLSSLMGEYRSFADVVTLDDLKAQELALGKSFPVPKIKGGRPLNVVAQRSELQEAFFGVPEISKNEFGVPFFEFDLKTEIKLEPTDTGSWSLEFNHSKKTYETRAQAEEVVVVAATTPKMTIDPNSIVGQFDNLRELTRKTKGKINALSLTGLANKAGLDYRLIDPNAVDFPDSKINISIKNMLAIYDKWNEDKGTQLVFCDLSVPLSAKAKMASNEKRVYVRDDRGNLTHKKGTLHAPKDFEGFPYYLVAEGKGKDRLFTMYDPVTGTKIKTGLESKQAAHEFVIQFLEREDGPVRWLDMRESSLHIEDDEIDEYKNAQGINEDGDSVDFEISSKDIEGVAGVTAFSIYDDIKAKLINKGIPANEIEFIHDHDTPQAKDALFKRVNAGEVRFLLGSTPKMGAGTNVQKRLVGLHHIDAPWRPSDLEQREGRIIRRGNMLYERDPDNFEVDIVRYATAQTYDTRRWQLLEHKAAGVDQLRKYNGENEIDDVASEASNSADMKAAASGNPLILKETQLATEVKKLRALARAHIDGEYVLNSRLNSANNYVNKFGPESLFTLNSLKKLRDGAVVLANYGGRNITTPEELLDFTKRLAKDMEPERTTKAIVYKGIEFVFKRDRALYIDMITSGEVITSMGELSPSGVITRMDNWVKNIDRDIAYVEKRMEDLKQEAIDMKGLMGKPFEKEVELELAIEEHGKVQRALMKANSAAAVKPEERHVFNAALMVQREKLIELGFSEAVELLGIGNDLDVVVDGSYIGRIENHENGIITQSVGRGEMVKHDESRFDWIPEIGGVVTIRYDGGNAKIIGQSQGIMR